MKTALRDVAKKNRDKMVSPNKGQLLRDNFIKNIEVPPASTIGCYWPIGSEIDVRPLIHKLYEEGHNTALPCIVDNGQPLIFREWEPEAVLVKSKFNIWEPCKQHHAEVTPNIIIVPLLAFDKQRHRLGYGGGFYDRTIAKFRNENLPLISIGVAYSEQEIEKVPNEDWDIQLDRIVTGTKII